MQTQIFALRVEPYHLVAAEVTDEAAATLLDAGEQVLLGTFEELGNLALQLVRPLVFISRASAGAGTARSQPPAHRAGQPAPGRLPGAELNPLKAAEVGSSCGAADGDRPIAVSAARVA